MSSKGLWVGVASAVVLGGIATGAYFWLRNRAKKDDESTSMPSDPIISGVSGSGGSGSSNSGSNNSPSAISENNILDLVAENLKKEVGGDKERFFRTLSDGSKYVFVTTGRYQAAFYNNGRINLYDKVNKEIIYKGNYSNGGKSISVTEGLNKGKTFKNDSIIENLRNSLKQYSNFAEENLVFEPKMGVFSTPFQF